MSEAERVSTPIEEEIGDAGSLLVLVPSMDPGDDECCSELLAMGDVTDRDVLSVTLTDSPDDRMAAWDLYLDGEPNRTAFVNVGDPTRSVAAVAPSIDVPGRSVTVESVSSPGDLTGLGIKVSSVLSDWSDDGNDISICFHTVTALLQYVDLQRAFRFLHVLESRFDAIGAVSHFHMDPTAHDEREINTLTTLFDSVIELDDGEWRVRSR